MELIMEKFGKTSFIRTAWRMILLWFERKDALVDAALIFMILLFAVSWILAPSDGEVEFKRIAAIAGKTLGRMPENAINLYADDIQDNIKRQEKDVSKLMAALENEKNRTRERKEEKKRKAAEQKERRDKYETEQRARIEQEIENEIEMEIYNESKWWSYEVKKAEAGMEPDFDKYPWSRIIAQEGQRADKELEDELAENINAKAHLNRVNAMIKDTEKKIASIKSALKEAKDKARKRIEQRKRRATTRERSAR